MSWWSNLSDNERALVLGGGFAAASAVLIGAVVASRLKGGIPIRVEAGPATRGLITQQVGETNKTLRALSERGVPVYVLLGSKEIQARRGATK